MYSPLELMHKVAEQEAEKNPEMRPSLDVFRRMFSLTGDEILAEKKKLKKKVSKRTGRSPKKSKSRKGKSAKKRKSKSASKSRERSAYSSYRRRRERFQENEERKKKEKEEKKEKETAKAKAKADEKKKKAKAKAGKGESAAAEEEGRALSPTARKYEKLMVSEPFVDDGAATDALRKLIPEVRERRITDVIEAPIIRVDTPEFCMKTLFDENFRRKNRDFMTALALERNSGNPFRRFLRRSNKTKELYALSFWCDMQTYLNTYSDHMHELEQIQLYRAKLLITHYLQPESTLLPFEVKEGLREMLLRHQGCDYIRAAQDQLSKCLLKDWQSSLREDVARFEQKCLVHRDVTQKQFSDQSSSMVENEQVHPVVRYMYTQHASGKQMELPTDPERRTTLAMQIMFDLFVEPEATVNTYFLHMDDLEPWEEDGNYGTLEIKPLVIVQRRDLIEEMARQAFNRRQRLKYLRMLQAVKNAVKKHRHSILEEQLRIERERKEMEVPSFLKAVKKGNAFVERARFECENPAQCKIHDCTCTWPASIMIFFPFRSFTDVVQDPVQREFFQGFLEKNKADGPMRFINDVNELILMRDAAQKHNMIKKIVKKYFPDPDTGNMTRGCSSNSSKMY